MDALKLSALETAKKIKARELTCIEVLEMHIALIERCNPDLNAMVESCFDLARERAQALHLQLKNHPEQIKDLPFFGVPFTMKEMIAVQGMKSTLGSIHRKDHVSDKDATVVRRLKDAGAILMGTSNVPEVGFWFECWNKVYGKTSNPYDISRTSGGSTGGDAALIGAGASPFAVGSDIGGSIRIPAAFCGVFGHKPTNSLIPYTGHAPIFEQNAAEFVGARYPLTVLGPLSRKAEDLWPLMDVLSGPDGFDQVVAKKMPLGAKIQNWSEIQIFTMPSPKIHATTETEIELSQSVINAGRYFEALGAQVTEMPEDLFQKAFELWTAVASSIQGKDFNTYLNPVGPISFVKEFLLSPFQLAHYTLPALLTAFLEKNISAHKDWNKALQELKLLKEILTEKLGINGILLMPVHPRTAPLHYTTMIRPFDFSYTGIINALRWPASSVPMGLSQEGLPLSVQVVANAHQDHLCLSACEALETAFGGWQTPHF